MIHIATVHWKTDKWIDIQLSYIEKHFRSEYRVYAFLNEVPGNHSHKFYYTNTEPIDQHAIKLNILADIITLSGEEEDILIFLDGDAFPISDEIEPFLRSKIATYNLIAIQRQESYGDIQPHPSFCATTIGFWNKLKGDWKMGFLWKDKTGLKITDVGGNLLRQLSQMNINWLPLHRSNRINLHPVWFGIYENLIYHHGAGFREPFERIDREAGIRMQLIYKIILLFRTLLAVLERNYKKNQKFIIKKNQQMGLDFFNRISNNREFYKELI